MNFLRNFSLLVFFTLLVNNLFAQGPGCPNVNAGADQTLDCATGNCTNITATFLETGETTSYTVDAVPYSPPFPYDLPGGNPVSVNVDDVWSNAINLPFTFCFFGDTYNQIIVGSNGLISFNVNDANGFCAWNYNATIPTNNTNTEPIPNAIFGVYQDIDPSVCGEIKWDVTGTAPCRTFVVSFNDICHFSCTDLKSTSMIVLYETTNAIEVYVENKELCSDWNDGNALIGIQNASSTIAYTPPHRNTSQWTTQNEAWRFTPDGNQNYVITWYDDQGITIGNEATANVCPTADMTYTAEVVYTNCNGDVITESDEVLITVNTSYLVSTEDDQEFCEGDTPFTIHTTVTDIDAGVTITGYEWYEINDLATIIGTSSNLTVNSTGTYEVHVFGSDGCEIISQTSVTYNPIPSVSPISDYTLCDDDVADEQTSFDLSSKDNEILNGQTGVTVTYYQTMADAAALTNALPTTNYTNTSNPQIIYVNLENTAAGCSITTQFNLVVNPNPIANQPNNIELCDDDTDGMVPFDLDSQTAIIIGGQSDVNVSYYLSLADAQATNNPLPLTYTNTSSPQIIFARIENTTTGCYSTTSFNLIVNPLPILNNVDNIVVCDDNLDGDDTNESSMFDLNAIQDNSIINGQSGMTVSYYLSETDAENNTNALSMPFSNTSSPQTLYFRLENNTTSCYIISNFTITVNPLPSIHPPNGIWMCDNADDGDDTNGIIQTFDLTSQTPIIVGAQTDVTVTYYENQADADAGVVGTEIANPTVYTNIVANNQTIYFRIEDVNTGCHRQDQFGIHVTPVPTISNPGLQTYCDYYDNSSDSNPSDGIINTLDFTTLDAGITNGQVVTVSYYETPADAESGSNAIVFPYENTANPTNQTFYIRVEDGGGCFTTDSFDILVNPAPNILADGDTDGDPFNDFTVTELFDCDDATADGFTTFILRDKENEILNGETGMNISYHATQNDALNNTTLLDPDTDYTNTTNPQTIFVRVENPSTNCINYTQFQLHVYANPVVNPLQNLRQCDDDYDGYMPFDLESQTTTVLGGQTGMVVTYHESQADADSGNAALNNPYTNPNTPLSAQEIFVRVENGTSGCFATTSFFIIIDPLPILYPIDDYNQCDDDGDGYMSFDLTTMDTEILNGQVGINVSYHYSLGEAENNQNPIITPIQNTLANGEDMIYYRLENSVTGCYATNHFMIRTNEVPFTVSQNTFEVCDDLVKDGFTEVDLSEMDDAIIAGQTGVSVYYYETADDAVNTSNPINSPYTNISDPQTIYYNITNNVSECFASGNFVLDVLDSPNLTEPTPLEVCDPDSDGIDFFDLTTKDSEIAGALVGTVNVTYHETQEDADLGVSAVATPTNYQNTDLWNQTIYVRVETITTGCFETTELQLIVHPTPQINFTPDDVVLCDDSTADEFTQVNLEESIPNILGGVPQADVQVSFYHTQQDAEAEQNPITNAIAYTNTTNPETIWVRVEYPTTNCASVVSFDIIVNALPVVSTPTPLELCDNTDDGEDANGIVQSFILTDKDAEILNGQAAEVSYHLTQAEAESGTNPLSSPFENTVPGVQTLWVRVAFTNTGCYNITTLDVRVNPLPTPLTPNPVEACDTDADGFTAFELDAALINEIQNGEAGVTITFHETYTDAENNVRPLTTPYTNINRDTQVIYARDTYNATGCYRIVEVILIANPAPQATQPTDYEVCDDNYDGVAQFDLTTKDSEILGGIDPATVTLSYHLNEADAQIGSNPIDTSVLYTNTSNPQTIWVRLADATTACYTLVHFDLIVNPIPTTITPVVYEMCDNADDGDATNGIIQTFDLDSQSAAILNGQTGMMVYFFETLAQAEQGALADRLQSPYTNITNPQTLHVRIEDLNTGCYALTTMDLRVLPVPNVNTNPTPLELCDNDDDGDATNGLVQTFDLTQAVTDILNGQATVTLDFYLSQNDLDTATNAIDITQPFTNTSNPQTLYVLATDTASPLSCSVTVELQLIVNQLPQLDTTFTDYLFCEDDNNGTYQATLADIDAFLLADATELPDMTVTYYLSAADAAVPQNPLPNNYTVHTGAILYARVSYTATGCSSLSGAITISVNQAPQVTQPTSMELCDDDTDGVMSFDLSSQNASINASPDVTITYHETSNDAIMSASALSSPYTNTSNPQTIYVRVEDNNTHCYSFTDFEISVNETPQFTVDTDRVYCIGEPAITLDFDLSLTQGTTYTYQWTDASGTVLGTDSTLEVSAAGVYTITISTATCEASKDISVTESQASSIEASDLTIVDFAGNNTMQIPAPTSFVDDYEYSLDGGAYTTTLSYENLQGGKHELIIRNIEGCQEKHLTFYIVDYMRFFTPNGDGYNDTWHLLGGNTQPGAKVHIFDRFGKLLAKIDPNGQGWDGRFNGHKLPSTDYWFSIELTDGRTKKGHFSLVRR